MDSCGELPGALGRYRSDPWITHSEALTLRQALRDGTIDQPRRYFKAIARTIDIAWDTAVGGDLAFPEVAGKRTAKLRMTNAYLPKVFAAAEQDGELAKALVEVLGMRAQPQGLMRPDRLMRVLRANLRSQGETR